MKTGLRVLAVCALGTSCSEPVPPARPPLVNVAVTGDATCLGTIAGHLLDREIAGMAVRPVWSGGLGTMELGPVAASDFERVRVTVEGFGCAKRVQRAPCRTPDTDVVICANPDPVGT